MLIEFSVSNFRSFKEKQTLSLVAGRDHAHPENLIPVDNDRLLKAAALYGANASGKSNLIKAMMVMRDFVLDSATKMNQGDPIKGISPFRLDEEASKQPSRFEIKMLVGSSQYEYGFSASEKRVFGEWLFAEPATGQKRRLFERMYDPVGEGTPWSFGPTLRKDETLLRERTRENSLVLSRGAELNVPELSEVFLWFRKRLAVLDLSKPPAMLTQATAVAAKKDENLRNRLSRLLHDADLGISGISIVGRGVPIYPAKPDLLRQSVERFQSGGMFLEVQTRHQVAQCDRAVDFDLRKDESNGTQRLFALAGLFLPAVDEGAPVVVDELECSMHPLLTRKLIELFQSTEMNPKGAQLIFATHDVTMMDPQLLRRDQIWLVEKNSEGASELYSLYDFKEGKGGARPRSTEAFIRNYLAGRYGAVPSFGPALEDLDLK